MPKTIRSSRLKSALEHAATPTDTATSPVEPAAEPVKMADWLGVDEVQIRTIDIKIGLAGAIRRNREAQGLTQANLAQRLGIARPRIAEMEAFRPEASLDALVPAFFASGGTTEQLMSIIRRTDRSLAY